MKYGYIRVSTDHQEFARQEFILKDYKLDKIFAEPISGTIKATMRDKFSQMLEVLKAGDSVYFESMSRMARSMQDLIDTTDLLAKKKKVNVIFVKENLTIDGSGMDAMNLLLFNIMGAFAQFERDLISDRTKQALRAKMQDPNFKIGKPKVYDDKLKAKIVAEYRKGKLSMGEIAEKFGVSKTTVFRFIKGKENKR